MKGRTLNVMLVPVSAPKLTVRQTLTDMFIGKVDRGNYLTVTFYPGYVKFTVKINQYILFLGYTAY